MVKARLPAFQPDRLDAASLRFWQDKGVGFTLHLPERLDMLDFAPRVREACMQTALDAAALAVEAGIPVLNLHLPVGVYFTLPDRRLYLYEEYEEECLPQLLRFRERMEEALRGRALLAQMRRAAALPVVTKPAHVREMGEEVRAAFDREARCTDLYALAFPSLDQAGPDRDYQASPVML